jgi:hypothetical protein
MQQVFSDTTPAPTPRMGHMVRLRKAQSILTVGPTRDADPRDYSILRLDMPHRDNANSDDPHKLVILQSGLSVTASSDRAPTLAKVRAESACSLTPA